MAFRSNVFVAEETKMEPFELAIKALELCSMSNNNDEIWEALQTLEEIGDFLTDRVLARNLLPEDLPRIFGLLCAMVAELPPYRFETEVSPQTKIPLREPIVREMRKCCASYAGILKSLLQQPIVGLSEDLSALEYLVESALPLRRYMPFRIVQMGKLADRLFDRSLFADPEKARLLSRIYSYKYTRFGTSGWRGRWNIDFTEYSVKCVAQAICDLIAAHSVPEFVANSVPGATGRERKILIIGYDSRAHAQRVAEWVAHVATENGIQVSFTQRDTPTPALIYWAAEVVGNDSVAAIINCTASHNPPEWQGIKFSPFNGVPAPTAMTDFLASRAHQLKLSKRNFSKTPLAYVRRTPSIEKFDPKNPYCSWLLAKERRGIPIDRHAIREYFKGKLVVIDEMHGASRGYFRRLMRLLGVRYRVIHSRKSQKALKELEYANPEWPYIAPLTEAVRKERAVLGVGFDTDADRFGIVSEKGEWIKANQIIPLLTSHLLKRGFQGKIVRTVACSRLIDLVARDKLPSAEHRPNPHIIPAYIRHAFYVTLNGDEGRFSGIPVFLQPVGIKYVIEGMLFDSEYRISYRPNFRDTLLLGGEESSGLTAKAHIPDKDGVFGNLLVVNMVAVEKATITELWKRLTSDHGTAWFERLDIDAGERTKESLLNYFFETPFLQSFAGLKVLFIGGVMYDVVEVQLAAEPKAEVYLELRASGTEPINRIYVEVIMAATAEEKEAEQLGRKVQKEVLGLLERFTVEEIALARTPLELAHVLSATEPRTHDIREAVAKRLLSDTMKRETLRYLRGKLEFLEIRNRKIALKWLSLLER